MCEEVANNACYQSLVLMAQACQNFATDPCPQAISEGEGVSALGRMKLGTAPGYDLVHPEFLKHLGPKALTWLADLFTRMIWVQ